MGFSPLDGARLFELLRGMMETQRDQTAILKEGIENAHLMVVVAMDKAKSQAPQQLQPAQPKVGTIVEFRRMNPRVFEGTEGIIYADEWLEDIERLLCVAELPERLRVEAAGLQLRDVARTWFRSESKLQVPGVTWKRFTQLFKRKFFPAAA